MKTVLAVVLVALLSANCALLWRIDAKLSGLFPTSQALASKDRDELRATVERLPAVRLASPYVFVSAAAPLPVEVLNVHPVAVKVENTEPLPVETALLRPLDVRLVK